MDLPLSDPPHTSTTTLTCPNTDIALTHKLATLLLPALSAAAVDSTATSLFSSPATVAVPLRHDLVSHLTLRSQTVVPQTLALISDPSSTNIPDINLDDPLDLVSFLVEEFVDSRRNLLGKVSGWILSDSREDKIDDFVQEMEMANFWSLDRRENVAEELVKNLDYKKKFRCGRSFDTEIELDRHLKDCEFKEVKCGNEGCKVRCSRKQAEEHDGVCAYKVLECEQKCGERVVRREMDRHCITVCRMKMVNCPFYQVGCGSAFPGCLVKEHCGEFLREHLGLVMRVKNEMGSGEEEIKERAEILDKSEFRKELAEALNVRYLTQAIKNVEAKLKKQLEINKDNTHNEQDGDQS